MSKTWGDVEDYSVYTREKFQSMHTRNDSLAELAGICLQVFNHRGIQGVESLAKERGLNRIEASFVETALYPNLMDYNKGILLSDIQYALKVGYYGRDIKRVPGVGLLFAGVKVDEPSREAPQKGINSWGLRYYMSTAHKHMDNNTDGVSIAPNPAQFEAGFEGTDVVYVMPDLTVAASASVSEREIKACVEAYILATWSSDVDETLYMVRRAHPNHGSLREIQEYLYSIGVRKITKKGFKVGEEDYRIEGIGLTAEGEVTLPVEGGPLKRWAVNLKSTPYVMETNLNRALLIASVFGARKN